ncbi:hypothetical protein [Streptomyces sp. NRRL WC-3744]|uniref:hypothetical protein n=1 Tax=Streptomyces sp. NRRL WC-3744 TaxID=1463935 RepID=UPI0004CA036D|nr:hypothetical protein [Streptomyces sp. NRRL WC-3744]
MSSRTSPISQPITIRRAVARDAKRLTRLVRGSGAYAGKYAAAVAGLLVAHMQSEARAAGLDRVKVVSHLPAQDFYHRVGAVRIGTALANPPAVPWDRPEFEFRVSSE